MGNHTCGTSAWSRPVAHGKCAETLAGAPADPPRQPEGHGFRLGLRLRRLHACGVCARICPTSALNLENMPERPPSIDFPGRQIALAVDMCVHVCSPAAMTIDHDPTFCPDLSARKPLFFARGVIKCKKIAPPRCILPGVEFARPASSAHSSIRGHAPPRPERYLPSSHRSKPQEKPQ